MHKNNDACSWWDRLITLPQYLVPQHALSMMMYRLARCEISSFKNLFIRWIIHQYQVNLDEAEETDLTAYRHFNAFFTRKLKSGVRPVAEGALTIVSPVDGQISQAGRIEQGQIVQAKGRSFSVTALLGGDDALAQQFEQGQFATIYLSPKDYHRIHMPLSGQLRAMRYIPGKLFSVNPRTAQNVDRLFARNERVVTVFETAAGPMVLVLVGAIFVGSMETVWAGRITPPYRKTIQDWQYQDMPRISLQKGQELGRFNMGSTVVMLLPKADKIPAMTCQAGEVVKMGQSLINQ